MSLQRGIVDVSRDVLSDGDELVAGAGSEGAEGAGAGAALRALAEVQAARVL